MSWTGMPFIDRKDTLDNRSLEQTGRNIDLKWSEINIYHSNKVTNSGWSQVLKVWWCYGVHNRGL